MPIFDIEHLKNSIGNLDKEVLFEYANGKKKKKVGPSSNRIFMEKKAAITEGCEK